MEQGGMEFQQLPTSYWRLAAHRMSEHYSLRSMVLLENRIIVRKTLRIRLHLVLLGDIVSKKGSSNLNEHRVKSYSSSGKPESDPTTRDSLEIAKVEERIFPGGGSDSSTFSTGFFQDREVDREDPNHNRKLDHGLGFIGGPSIIQPEYASTIQPEYAPAINYNTEFPQLGSSQRPPITSDRQPHPIPHSLLGPQVAPSPPLGIGYGPAETTFSPSSHGHNCSREMSGTIVISLHVDGCIYSGADGRCVGIDGKIVDGSKQKLHSLNENKVLGTTCGRSLFGKTVLLKKAKERLENSVSPTDIMAELKKDAENWTESEALEWLSEIYPSRLGLCGFANDEPYLLLSDALLGRGIGVSYILSGGMKAIVSLSGTGAEYVLKHIRDRKKAIFEPNANIRELVLECLAFASLHCPNCGGYFQTAILKNNGELEMNNKGPHLIAQIAKSFDQLAILKNSLIHVTYNALYNVCGGLKDEMNALLKKTFDGVTLVNVLGVENEKMITVRLVVFKKKSALLSALRALKGKEKILIPPKSFLKLDSQVKERKLSWSLLRPKLQDFETLSKEFKRDSSW